MIVTSSTLARMDVSIPVRSSKYDETGARTMVMIAAPESSGIGIKDQITMDEG